MNLCGKTMRRGGKLYIAHTRSRVLLKIPASEGVGADPKETRNGDLILMKKMVTTGAYINLSIFRQPSFDNTRCLAREPPYILTMLQ